MIKVGDKVRLTGSSWNTYEDKGGDIFQGAIVEVTENGIDGIWAGEAGTVGNRNGLYSESNPEESGDYSCELVSGYVDTSSFEQNVRRITDQIADLLISKNKAYGDSALNPIRVFSKSDRIEQLNVRIDDKISRIQRGTDFEDEDTVRDLAGYLVLRLIAEESE